MNTTNIFIQIKLDGLSKYPTPDNSLTSDTSSWALRETEEGVTISTEVDYVADAKNRFAATYRYSVARDGDLRLQYKILPDVVVSSVPVVGMTIESVPELNQIRWFGLGPHDAYPNKRSAPMLGVW